MYKSNIYGFCDTATSDCSDIAQGRLSIQDGTASNQANRT